MKFRARNETKWIFGIWPRNETKRNRFLRFVHETKRNEIDFWDLSTKRNETKSIFENTTRNDTKVVQNWRNFTKDLLVFSQERAERQMLMRPAVISDLVLLRGHFMNQVWFMQVMNTVKSSKPALYGTVMRCICSMLLKKILVEDTCVKMTKRNETKRNWSSGTSIRNETKRNRILKIWHETKRNEIRFWKIATKRNETKSDFENLARNETKRNQILENFHETKRNEIEIRAIWPALVPLLS